MKNFFIKCHREYVARRGGSGGSEFDTTFDNGWRKLIKEPALALWIMKSNASYLNSKQERKQNEHRFF